MRTMLTALLLIPLGESLTAVFPFSRPPFVDLHVIQTVAGNLTVAHRTYPVAGRLTLYGLDSAIMGSNVRICEENTCYYTKFPTAYDDVCPKYPDCYLCWDQVFYGRCTSASIYYITNVVAIILTFISIYYLVACTVPAYILVNTSYNVVKWPASRLLTLMAVASTPAAKAQPPVGECLTQVLPSSVSCDEGNVVCQGIMPEGCIQIKLKSAQGFVNVCLSPVEDEYYFSAEYDFVWPSNIQTSHQQNTWWAPGGIDDYVYQTLGDVEYYVSQYESTPGSLSTPVGDSVEATISQLSSGVTTGWFCSQNVNSGYRAEAVSSSAIKGTLYNPVDVKRQYRLCIQKLDNLKRPEGPPLMNQVIDGQTDFLKTDFPADTIDILQLGNVANQDVGDYMEDMSVIARHRSQSSDLNAYHGYFTNTLDQKFSGCEGLVDSNRTRYHILNTCDDLVIGGFLSEFVRSIAWPAIDEGGNPGTGTTGSNRDYFADSDVLAVCKGRGNHYTRGYSTPDIYPIGSSKWIPKYFQSGTFTDFPASTIDLEASAALEQCVDWGFTMYDVDPRKNFWTCLAEYFATYYYAAKKDYSRLVDFDAYAVSTWVSSPAGPSVFSGNEIYLDGLCYVWDAEDAVYMMDMKVTRNMDKKAGLSFYSYGCVRNALLRGIARYSTNVKLSGNSDLYRAVNQCMGSCWNTDSVMTPKGDWRYRRRTLFTEDYECNLNKEVNATSNGQHGCYMYPYVRFPHTSNGMITSVYMINTSSPAAVPSMDHMSSGLCYSCSSDGVEVDNNFASFLPQNKFLPVKLGGQTALSIQMDTFSLFRSNPDAPRPYIYILFDEDLSASWAPSNGSTEFDEPLCGRVQACADYAGSPDSLAVSIFVGLPEVDFSRQYMRINSMPNSDCAIIGDGYEAVHIVNESYAFMEVMVNCGSELSRLEFVVNDNSECIEQVVTCDLRVPNNNYNPGQNTDIRVIEAKQGCAFFDLSCLFSDPLKHIWSLVIGALITIITILLLVAVGLCIARCACKQIVHED